MQEDITGKVAKALIELTGTGDVYKVVEADEILERLHEGDRPDKQTLGTAIRDLRGLGCIEVKYFTPDEYCLLVTRRAAELFRPEPREEDPLPEKEAAPAPSKSEREEKTPPPRLLQKVLLAAFFGGMLGGAIVAAIAILLQKFAL